MTDERARELFHVSLPDEWAAAQADGRCTTSTRGKTLAEEGYIHCSFTEQIDGVLARFYADVDEVVVLRIDPHRVPSPIVVEDLFDVGEAFPHIYGPIPLDAVIDATTARPAAMRADDA